MKTALLAALVLLPLVGGCRIGNSAPPGVLAEPASAKGYVVMRVIKPGMGSQGSAVFDHDFRLHYRRASTGPVRSMLSSTRLGKYIDVRGGEGAKFVMLELEGGAYIFHSLVTSLQEAPINLNFSCATGQLSYIGDIEVSLRTRQTQAGLTGIESAAVFAHDRIRAMEEDVAQRYPNGHPPLKKRLASQGFR